MLSTEFSSSYSLPTCIHLQIISYLPAKDKYSTSKVCRAWKTAAENLAVWKKEIEDFKINSNDIKDFRDLLLLLEKDAKRGFAALKISVKKAQELDSIALNSFHLQPSPEKLSENIQIYQGEIQKKKILKLYLIQGLENLLFLFRLGLANAKQVEKFAHKLSTDYGDGIGWSKFVKELLLEDNSTGFNTAVRDILEKNEISFGKF